MKKKEKKDKKSFFLFNKKKKTDEVIISESAETEKSEKMSEPTPVSASSDISEPAKVSEPAEVEVSEVSEASEGSEASGVSDASDAPKSVEPVKPADPVASTQSTKPTQSIKQAVIPEEKDAEKEKPGKKKILFIVIPAILIIGISVSAGAFYFLTHRSPDNYWDEKEKVASITKVVGSRKCKLDKKKSSVTYLYNDAKSAGADIKKYVKYLESNKEFADISMPDIKDLEAAENTDKAADKKSKDANKTDTKEKKKAVKHYELGADSKKDGKLLKATIDVKKSSYTIKITTEKGTLEDKLAMIEKKLEKEREKLEKKQAKNAPAHNFEDALNKIQSLSQEQLGLDTPPEQLKFFPDKGRYLVKGNDFYKITAYKSSETGVTIYAGSYLADCKSLSKFYKYNEQTMQCTKIK